MLITGGSGSGKVNVLLIREQDNDEPIDDIYLYAKDINEPKHQLLIKRCKSVRIKHLKIQKHL